MSEPTREAVLSALRAQTQERRGQLRTGVALFGGIAGGFIVLLTLFAVVTGQFQLGTFLNFVVTLGLVLLLLLSVTHKHKEAVQNVLSLDDPELAPHLLEVLDSDDAGLKKEVRSRLASLLPQLNPSHQLLFDPRSRHLLATLLKAPEPEVRKAAMEALMVVGAQEALPYLEEASQSLKAEPERIRARESAGLLRHRLAAHQIEAESVPPAFQNQREG